MSERERGPELPPVKLTVVIPQSEYAKLRLMALRKGITRTEALKQSIADRFWLEERINEGSDLLIRDPKGEITKVIFQSPTPEVSPDDRVE